MVFTLWKHVFFFNFSENVFILFLVKKIRVIFYFLTSPSSRGKNSKTVRSDIMLGFEPRPRRHDRGLNLRHVYMCVWVYNGFIISSM